MFLTDRIHIKHCNYVTQKQARQRNVQNVSSSSSASQHEGPIIQAQLLDPTQPNPTHQKLKNLDPTRPDPWVNQTHGHLWSTLDCGVV